MTKNIITSALNFDEFFRVSQCSPTKEMWHILVVTHQGTSYVKRARKHALTQEYELLSKFKISLSWTKPKSIFNWYQELSLKKYIINCL